MNMLARFSRHWDYLSVTIQRSNSIEASIGQNVWRDLISGYQGSGGGRQTIGRSAVPKLSLPRRVFRLSPPAASVVEFRMHTARRAIQEAMGTTKKKCPYWGETKEDTGSQCGGFSEQTLSLRRLGRKGWQGVRTHSTNALQRHSNAEARRAHYATRHVCQGQRGDANAVKNSTIHRL